MKLRRPRWLIHLATGKRPRTFPTDSEFLMKLFLNGLVSGEWMILLTIIVMATCSRRLGGMWFTGVIILRSVLWTWRQLGRHGVKSVLWGFAHLGFSCVTFCYIPVMFPLMSGLLFAKFTWGLMATLLLLVLFLLRVAVEFLCTSWTKLLPVVLRCCLAGMHVLTSDNRYMKFGHRIDRQLLQLASACRCRGYKFARNSFAMASNSCYSAYCHTGRLMAVVLGVTLAFLTEWPGR